MIHLRRVLAAKIAITVLAWAIPLLLFPADLLVFLGFPSPHPEIFLRLLGTAYCALVVGYVLGFNKTKANKYPVEAVWVGIASNGGATFILAIAAMMGAWSNWGAFAQIYMWFSLLSVALISFGLVMFGPCTAVANSQRIESVG